MGLRGTRKETVHLGLKLKNRFASTKMKLAGFPHAVFLQSYLPPQCERNLPFVFSKEQLKRFLLQKTLLFPSLDSRVSETLMFHKLYIPYTSVYGMI